MKMFDISVATNALEGVDVFDSMSQDNDENNQNIEDKMWKVLGKMLNTAKDLCPVLTGALRSSGHRYRGQRDNKGIHNMRIIFGNINTQYAYYIHEGTTYIPPNPFLYMAVRMHEHELPEEVREGFAENWNSAVRRYSGRGGDLSIAAGNF